MKRGDDCEGEFAPNAEIVVLGLGNLLLRDDGVGVHAVQAFQKDCPAGVLAVDVGTAILSIESLTKSAHLVIAFDALRAGCTPGSVYATDASGLLGGGIQKSLHEYSFVETMNELKKKPEILILGVEPAVIEHGCELSDAVRAAVPVLIEHALAVIRHWQSFPDKGNGLRCGSLLDWVGEQPGVRRIQAEPVHS